LGKIEKESCFWLEINNHEHHQGKLYPEYSTSANLF
jgi:hypothetical protein